MSRYRAFYDGQGKLAEYQDDVLIWARPNFESAPEPSGPQIIPDIPPYQSMIDGSIIDGRKRHRDHLKAHGCVEIGSDTSHMNRKRVPPAISVKESLYRVLADVGDRDIKRIIQKTIKDMR